MRAVVGHTKGKGVELSHAIGRFLKMMFKGDFEQVFFFSKNIFPEKMHLFNLIARTSKDRSEPTLA